jgi:hypothetical protein
VNFDVDIHIFCVVHNYVEAGVNLLQVTQEGNGWITRIHSHVFECEHFSSDSEVESTS